MNDKVCVYCMKKIPNFMYEIADFCCLRCKVYFHLYTRKKRAYNPLVRFRGVKIAKRTVQEGKRSRGVAAWKWQYSIME